MASFILPTGQYDSAGARIPVNYQHTPNFVEILQQLRASLVVSTYQVGKILVLGTHNGRLSISFLNYDRPTGVAIGRDRMTVGAVASIHFLQANYAAASGVQRTGSHDGCFVSHSSRPPSKILVHDLGWGTEIKPLCTEYKKVTFKRILRCRTRSPSQRERITARIEHCHYGKDAENRGGVSVDWKRDCSNFL